MKSLTLMACALVLVGAAAFTTQQFGHDSLPSRSSATGHLGLMQTVDSAPSFETAGSGAWSIAGSDAVSAGEIETASISRVGGGYGAVLSLAEAASAWDDVWDHARTSLEQPFDGDIETASTARLASSDRFSRGAVANAWNDVRADDLFDLERFDPIEAGEYATASIGVSTEVGSVETLDEVANAWDDIWNAPDFGPGQ